jgi:hypothetical protein
MNCYRTRVCLLQFLVGGEVYLVDALAPGLRLEPLWAILATKPLLMHGSDFDLRLLQDLCGFRAHSLFDTMLAAQLLNRSRTGLAPLLEEHFGVTLDKASQRANWSRRPFTPRLLDYAALDVWHLPALRDLLVAELKQLNRLDWLDQQCRRQIESARVGFPDRRRKLLAGRPQRTPARPGPLRPARRLALARGLGPQARHAPVQGLQPGSPAPTGVCGRGRWSTPEAILARVDLGKRHAAARPLAGRHPGPARWRATRARCPAAPAPTAIRSPPPKSPARTR